MHLWFDSAPPSTWLLVGKEYKNAFIYYFWFIIFLRLQNGTKENLVHICYLIR